MSRALPYLFWMLALALCGTSCSPESEEVLPSSNVDRIESSSKFDRVSTLLGRVRSTSGQGILVDDGNGTTTFVDTRFATSVFDPEKASGSIDALGVYLRRDQDPLDNPRLSEAIQMYVYLSDYQEIPGHYWLVGPDADNYFFAVAWRDESELASVDLERIPEKERGEQGGARQPTTAPDSKPEGSEKPKPESEGRSQ